MTSPHSCNKLKGWLALQIGATPRLARGGPEPGRGVSLQPQNLTLSCPTAVIVHINHISQSKKPKGDQRSPQSEIARLVTGSLMSLVEDGVLDARLAPSLRIHLDWIQYKTNFRDPVIVRRTTSPQGQVLPLAEIAIDLRQADAARLPEELARAVQNIGAGPQSNGYNHLYLDEFRPYRDCLIWAFN